MVDIVDVFSSWFGGGKKKEKAAEIKPVQLNQRQKHQIVRIC